MFGQSFLRPFDGKYRTATAPLVYFLIYIFAIKMMFLPKLQFSGVIIVKTFTSGSFIFSFFFNWASKNNVTLS